MRFKPTNPEIAWRSAYPFEDRSVCVFYPGHICHFGTSQKSTTQTTTSQPWAPQQPYLQSGFSQAANLLNQPAPTQSNPVAPLNATELSALSGINGVASNNPITGAATGFATSLENGDFLKNNPGNGTFADYASGKYLPNGYSDDTAKSIMAQVIPGIQGAFNNGNNINNPAAAYAAANGVTAALAPIEYQNYQNQEQLQQAGATGLSNNFNTGVTQMVQGNALAPQTQALSYGDLQQMFNAGQVQQTQAQNEASGQAATQNFAQMSPYQQLQAYMQAITGGVTGSQGSTTTPYFQNNTANTLGAVTGGASLLTAALPLLAMI